MPARATRSSNPGNACRNKVIMLTTCLKKESLMVYSNQCFTTLSFFSCSALLVPRPHNHFYPILKLFILVLFFLSAPVNIFIPGSPLVEKLFALSNQQRVLLSSGVVLR